MEGVLEGEKENTIYLQIKAILNNFTAWGKLSSS